MSCSRRVSNNNKKHLKKNSCPTLVTRAISKSHNLYQELSAVRLKTTLGREKNKTGKATTNLFAFHANAINILKYGNYDADELEEKYRKFLNENETLSKLKRNTW